MRPLSVALLTWEYPPVVVGGLSRHVRDLARALAANGHRVAVYTRGRPDAAPEEIDEGVRIVRADGYPPHIPFEQLVPWSLAFNLALLHRVQADLSDGPPDVLHAHDWLVAYAAAAIKDLHGIPLVATVHATERGRHLGRLPGPTQRFVDEVERWLTQEATRVVTCSAHMRRDVTETFRLSPQKVELIPNEVDPEPFRRRGRSPRRRRNRTVLFAGRLEHEKGVHVLLEALPLVASSIPGVRLVVAGDGTYREPLERLARAMGLGARVRFAGFVEEATLAGLYADSDVVVVPSLYEPFGLVALESMAAGTPVVVSDTGGLREIVDHGITGLRVPPGDPLSLARAVATILTDGELSSRLSREASNALAARRRWTGVAARTAETYALAIREHAVRPQPGRLRSVLERRS